MSLLGCPLRTVGTEFMNSLTESPHVRGTKMLTLRVLTYLHKNQTCFQLLMWYVICLIYMDRLLKNKLCHHLLASLTLPKPTWISFFPIVFVYISTWTTGSILKILKIVLQNVFWWCFIFNFTLYILFYYILFYI